MAKLLTILFVALCFETTGVILLSKGLKTLPGPAHYSPGEIARLVGRGFMSKHLVLGVAFEAVFFVGLLIMMSNGDVSFVWPLTSLTFVFSTIAAKFYLREEIDGLRWAGVLLIVCGAGLITFTEKRKEKAGPTPSLEAAGPASPRL
ncbi:MAG TPA: EamA family transporter [Verrucomicrobiae bacterium]|nr:EamA family transporter [Verrucomicrobiae bacterium]